MLKKPHPPLLYIEQKGTAPFLSIQDAKPKAPVSPDLGMELSQKLSRNCSLSALEAVCSTCGQNRFTSTVACSRAVAFSEWPAWSSTQISCWKIAANSRKRN